MDSWRLMSWAAVLFGSVSMVFAQPSDDGGANPYFDCPYVDYFDPGCPQLREQRQTERRRQGVPEPQPVPGRLDDEGDSANREGAGQEVLRDELVLFPRESLAPDAPPLFRILLANPTPANARRYVRWHARRSAQLQVVQALIQRAGKELETNPGAALQPVVNRD